ncbi:hypothetical protein EV182_000137 [Spiromyces aspiralis]|uniref:Uncharacterized protein n=1 Tax=Spiromyces aspiralis TaxID=68401 RepID=A0ACC1HWB7_9FUNG|nr:hypothetical protein EV182_000137 [Spiromyces aspiralis]
MDLFKRKTKGINSFLISSPINNDDIIERPTSIRNTRINNALARELSHKKSDPVLSSIISDPDRRPLSRGVDTVSSDLSDGLFGNDYTASRKTSSKFYSTVSKYSDPGSKLHAFMPPSSPTAPVPGHEGSLKRPLSSKSNHSEGHLAADSNSYSRRMSNASSVSSSTSTSGGSGRFATRISRGSSSGSSSRNRRPSNELGGVPFPSNLSQLVSASSATTAAAAAAAASTSTGLGGSGSVPLHDSSITGGRPSTRASTFASLASAASSLRGQFRDRSAKAADDPSSVSSSLSISRFGKPQSSGSSAAQHGGPESRMAVSFETVDMDDDEINQRLEATMREMNLKDAQKQQMRLMPREKKLLLLTQKFESQSSGRSNDPNYFYRALTETDIRTLSQDILVHLRVCLSTQPIGWVRNFVDTRGLVALSDCLGVLNHKSVRKNDDNIKEQELIRCMKSIMNIQWGAQEALRIPRCVKNLCFSIDAPSLNTRRLVAELLTFLCYCDPPSGHDAVLGGLEAFQSFRGSDNVFEPWLRSVEMAVDGRGRMGSLVGASSEIRSGSVTDRDLNDFVLAHMILVNSIITVCDNVEMRIKHRTLLNAAGLDRIVEKVRQFNSPLINIQLEKYERDMEQDYSDAIDMYNTELMEEMTDPAEVLQAILAQIENDEEAQDHFISMLQHILMLRGGSSTNRSKYFQVLDNIVYQVTLNQGLGGADDGNIDPRHGVNVGSLIQKFSNDEELEEALRENKELKDKLEKVTKQKNELELETSMKADGLVGTLKGKIFALEDLLRMSRHTIEALQTQIKELRDQFTNKLLKQDAQLKQLYGALREEADENDMLQRLRDDLELENQVLRSGRAIIGGADGGVQVNSDKLLAEIEKLKSDRPQVNRMRRAREMLEELLATEGEAVLNSGEKSAGPSSSSLSSLRRSRPSNALQPPPMVDSSAMRRTVQSGNIDTSSAVGTLTDASARGDIVGTEILIPAVASVQPMANIKKELEARLVRKQADKLALLQQPPSAPRLPVEAQQEQEGNVDSNIPDRASSSSTSPSSAAVLGPAFRDGTNEGARGMPSTGAAEAQKGTEVGVRGSPDGEVAKDEGEEGDPAEPNRDTEAGAETTEDVVPTESKVEDVAGGQIIKEKAASEELASMQGAIAAPVTADTHKDADDDSRADDPTVTQQLLREQRVADASKKALSKVALRPVKDQLGGTDPSAKSASVRASTAKKLLADQPSVTSASFFNPLRRKELRYVPKVKLKVLQWDKLSDTNVDNSLWANLHEKSGINEQELVDTLKTQGIFDRIEDLFAAKQAVDLHALREKKRKEKELQKAEEITVLDNKRSHHTNIMLRNLKKYSMVEIRHAILAMNTEIITETRLKQFLNFIPTPDERALLAGHMDNKDRLAKPERFFLEMMQIHRYEHRLKVMYTYVTWPERYRDIEHDIGSIMSASHAVLQSVNFPKILEIILSIGNFMNGSGFRGGAYGFRIASLNKLMDTKAQDNKTTLLHFVATVVEEKFSNALTFLDDLNPVDAGCRVAYQDLRAEFKAMGEQLGEARQELQIMKEYREQKERERAVDEAVPALPDAASDSASPAAASSTAEESGSSGSLKKDEPEDRFIEVISEFVERATEQYEGLQSQFTAMRKTYEESVRTYGEDPTRTVPDEFFGIFKTFTSSFSKVLQDNKRERERKQALEKRRNQMESTMRSRRSKSTWKRLERDTNTDGEGASNGDIKGAMDELLESLRNGTEMEQQRQNRRRELKSIRRRSSLRRSIYRRSISQKAMQMLNEISEVPEIPSKFKGLAGPVSPDPSTMSEPMGLEVISEEVNGEESPVSEASNGLTALSSVSQDASLMQRSARLASLRKSRRFGSP